MIIYHNQINFAKSQLFNFVPELSNSPCERKAEWQGSDNRKTMLKVKTAG